MNQVQQVKYLRWRGMNGMEISRMTGIPKTTVYTHLERQGKPLPPGTLAPAAWRAYLDSIESRVEVRGQVPMIAFNGVMIGDDGLRTVRHWRVEDHAPGFWSVDAFLTKIGLHINDFLEWCVDRDINPWYSGVAPWWEKGMPWA